MSVLVRELVANNSILYTISIKVGTFSLARHCDISLGNDDLFTRFGGGGGGSHLQLRPGSGGHR
jgi:hypothetical protein